MNGDDVTMTCGVAGRRGGLKTKATIGPDGYAKIGASGGAVTKAKYGSEHFARIAKLAQAARAANRAAAKAAENV